MEYTLTKTQKQLMKLAKEKGFLMLDDFNAAYSSPITRKAVMERLNALGLIECGEGFKFIYKGEVGV